MHKVKFDRWTVSVDIDATAAAYARLEKGDAQSCGCEDCRNWIDQRAKVFPVAFVDLLRDLGIDPLKETEVSDYGASLVPGFNLYTGEYLFIGELIEGPDCFAVQPGGKDYSLELLPVFGDLKIGLSSNEGMPMSNRTQFANARYSVLMFQAYASRGYVYDV
jgi:hypothetical protein